MNRARAQLLFTTATWLLVLAAGARASDPIVSVRSLLGAPIPERELILEVTLAPDAQLPAGTQFIVGGDVGAVWVADPGAARSVTHRVLLRAGRETAPDTLSLVNAEGERITSRPIALGSVPRGTMRVALLGDTERGLEQLGASQRGVDVQLIARADLPAALPGLDVLVLGPGGLLPAPPGLIPELEAAVTGGLRLVLASPIAIGELSAQLTIRSRLTRALAGRGVTTSLGAGRVVRTYLLTGTAADVGRQIGSLRAEQLLAGRPRAFEAAAASELPGLRLTETLGTRAGLFAAAVGIGVLGLWFRLRRRPRQFALTALVASGALTALLWVPLGGVALGSSHPLGATRVTAAWVDSAAPTTLVEEQVAVVSRQAGALAVCRGPAGAAPIDATEWQSGSARAAEGTAELRLGLGRVGRLGARHVGPSQNCPITTHMSGSAIHLGNQGTVPLGPVLVYSGVGGEPGYLATLEPGQLASAGVDPLARRALEEDWSTLLRLPFPDLAEGEFLCIVEAPGDGPGSPARLIDVAGAFPDVGRSFWIVRLAEAPR